MCCRDLWYLEVEVPAPAARVALVRASTHSLELCWLATPTAQMYMLECQKIESTPVAAAAPVALPPPPPQPIVTPTPVTLTTPPPPQQQQPTQVTVQPPVVQPQTSIPLQQSGDIKMTKVMASASPVIISSTANPQQATAPAATAVIKKPMISAMTFTSTAATAAPLRVVTTSSTGSSAPIRVLSSGQTVRLAAGTAAGTARATTAFNAVASGSTTTASSAAAATSSSPLPPTAATISGKQILLQKPMTLSGQNLLQLVKTSHGMQVVQKAAPSTAVGGTTISTASTGQQQQHQQQPQIVASAGGSGGSATSGGAIAKTALIGGNVVKLMSPATVAGNKILMKNSNLMQVS